VGPHLKTDFPEVEQAVRTVYVSFLLQYQEKKFQEDQVLAADASLFEVFDFPFKAGNPKTALVAPHSIVITERGATKYFGNEDPMGKSLQVNGKYTATVTGVAKDLPENSQFKSDILLSMTTIHELYGREWESEWGAYGWYTYILLPKDYNPEKLQAKLPAFIHKYTGPSSQYGQKAKMMTGSPSRYALFLEPLTQVYLHSDRDSPTKGSLTNVYIFSVIALFILLIACFNYTNLSIAKATQRA
jgi:putative ABC transport system permease protein